MINAEPGRRAEAARDFDSEDPPRFGEWVRLDRSPRRPQPAAGAAGDRKQLLVGGSVLLVALAAIGGLAAYHFHSLTAKPTTHVKSDLKVPTPGGEGKGPPDLTSHHGKALNDIDHWDIAHDPSQLTPSDNNQVMHHHRQKHLEAGAAPRVVAPPPRDVRDVADQPPLRVLPHKPHQHTGHNIVVSNPSHQSIRHRDTPVHPQISFVGRHATQTGSGQAAPTGSGQGTPGVRSLAPAVGGPNTSSGGAGGAPASGGSAATTGGAHTTGNSPATSGVQNTGGTHDTGTHDTGTHDTGGAGDKKPTVSNSK